MSVEYDKGSQERFAGNRRVRTFQRFHVLTRSYE